MRFTKYTCSSQLTLRRQSVGGIKLEGGDAFMSLGFFELSPSHTSSLGGITGKDFFTHIHHQGNLKQAAGFFHFVARCYFKRVLEPNNFHLSELSFRARNCKFRQAELVFCRGRFRGSRGSTVVASSSRSTSSGRAR